MLTSKVNVIINILDVNEFPPEISVPYETSVCENAKPGQVFQICNAFCFAFSFLIIYSNKNFWVWKWHNGWNSFTNKISALEILTFWNYICWPLWSICFYCPALFGPEPPFTVHLISMTGERIPSLKTRKCKGKTSMNRWSRMDYTHFYVLFWEKGPTTPKKILLEACFYKQFQLYT